MRLGNTTWSQPYYFDSSYFSRSPHASRSSSNNQDDAASCHRIPTLTLELGGLLHESLRELSGVLDELEQFSLGLSCIRSMAKIASPPGGLPCSPPCVRLRKQDSRHGREGRAHHHRQHVRTKNPQSRCCSVRKMEVARKMFNSATEEDDCGCYSPPPPHHIHTFYMLFITVPCTLRHCVGTSNHHLLWPR